MIKHTLIGALLVAGLALAGCDRRPSNPDLPKAETSSAVPPAPVKDTSLPSATTALAAPEGTPTAPPTAERDTAAPMSKASESIAMPLGGQANDHSAPKAGESASAASR